jgi:hypothetical protein
MLLLDMLAHCYCAAAAVVVSVLQRMLRLMASRIVS